MAHLSYRENFLRAIRFRYPEYIPTTISVFWPLWNTYRKKLEEIAERYKMFFLGFNRGRIKYEGKPGIIYVDEYRYDAFKCLWHFNIKGYQGQVVKHPLSDWKNFRDFQLPDPDKGVPTESNGIVSWNNIFEEMERARDEGNLVVAGMPHGFFFQRLYYLRGFKNLMIDFIYKPPEIYELIEKLTEYNFELVKRFLKFNGIDFFSFGDDLGLQDRMPISPKTFKEFIYPSYRKIFGEIRSRGLDVRLHSDGHIIEVVDQIVESGVNILNLQDAVNGLENIRKLIEQRIAIQLDIDRQKLIPCGGPEEIERYIKHVVDMLAFKEGGLLFYAEIHPPTPLENIRALAKAFEKYVWLNI